MIEDYLGEEQARDIFVSSMLANLMTEKQAEAFVCGIEKSAQRGGGGGTLSGIGKLLGGLGNLAKDTGNVAMSAFEKIPPGLGWLMALGAGTGVLGSTAYDVIKERTSHEDPEAKMNEEIEAMYNAKTREREDANWMARVRRIRDELRRGMKKMPTKEYATKYRQLMDALDEKKEMA